VKLKLCYNAETRMKEKLEFLKMNNIDDYNTNMGSMDVADQLRGGI